MMKKTLYLTLLALLCFATGLGAQQARIRGVVTDGNGDPVPGAGVLVKGTTNGVVTAADGTVQTGKGWTDVKYIDISFN